MATYKVIQDIEAEDKLLGPLSMRQFIYAVIVVILGFLMFRLFFVSPLLCLPFLPPAILFAVLAAPFGHDQSSEIWLLAKIRFSLKPRIRIWDQSGLKELVTINAPKKVERHLTNGLNETQVRSRLEALAQTIDTRGWVVKGVDVNLFSNPTYAPQQQTNSDRLIDPTIIAPVPVAEVNITANDDMLDTLNNPLAHQVDQMMQASGQAVRQNAVQRMQHAAQGKDNLQSSLPIPDPQQSYTAYNPQTFSPGMSTQADDTPPSIDEQLLTKRLQQNHKQNIPSYGHMRVIQPPGSKAANDNATSDTQNSTPPVTAPPNPAILELANNDDLSVATIARQANKANQSNDDGEVVVSLR